jgi:hypothetical protein
VNKLLFIAMLLLAGAAVAQTPAETPVKAPPPADSLDPGVNTSAPVPASDAMEPGVNTSAPAPAPAPATPAATRPAAGVANKPAARPQPAAASRGNAKDRLDLDSTQITGNRELPKVLYIVPWRSAELGDLVGRPVNSLLDEVLEPVDRDVFRRQNRYFEALQPNEAAPAGKPEK